MYDKACNECLKKFDSLSTKNKIRGNNSNLYQNSMLGSIQLSDLDEDSLSDRGSMNQV